MLVAIQGILSTEPILATIIAARNARHLRFESEKVKSRLLLNLLGLFLIANKFSDTFAHLLVLTQNPST